MAFVCKVICLMLIIAGCVRCKDWDYHERGPDIWSEMYPKCAGQSQSPINIITACTVYKDFPPFSLSSNFNSTLNFTLTNTGNTISGALNPDHNSASLELVGGGLDGRFQFVNFHFHWGENHKSGSEHQVNGVKYAGEIHLVFLNPITNQIAVLGKFIRSHVAKKDTSPYPYDNIIRDEWQTYFDAAETLRTQNSSTLINLSLASLIGHNRRDFWRYGGSLTTPPCTEGLIWNVFKEPIVLAESQLRSFRRKLRLEYLREPQPMYERKVYRNFVNEIISPNFNQKCC